MQFWLIAKKQRKEIYQKTYIIMYKISIEEKNTYIHI